LPELIPICACVFLALVVGVLVAVLLEQRWSFDPYCPGPNGFDLDGAIYEAVSLSG